MQEGRQLGPSCKVSSAMTPRQPLMRLPTQHPMGKPQTLWVSSMQVVSQGCPTLLLQFAPEANSGVHAPDTPTASVHAISGAMLVDHDCSTLIPGASATHMGAWSFSCCNSSCFLLQPTTQAWSPIWQKRAQTHCLRHQSSTWMLQQLPSTTEPPVRSLLRPFNQLSPTCQLLGVSLIQQRALRC